MGRVSGGRHIKHKLKKNGNSASNLTHPYEKRMPEQGGRTGHRVGDHIFNSHNQRFNVGLLAFESYSTEEKPEDSSVNRT